MSFCLCPLSTYIFSPITMKPLKSLFSRFGGDNVPPAPQAVVASSGAGLGTFGGVFTPSILTILGVIMYLRFGWVVGNAGLVGTLLIVTISTSITFLTGLSISQIATDQRVRAGGAYYMISRSLGIEAGGAVGIPLYFAQALSVALYTIGFAESLVAIFPNFDQRTVGIITTVLVAGLALVSAKTAIRSQYVIMAAIGVSLLSFYFGHGLEPTSLELFGAAPRNSEPFWTVFAVFFPAVTGIMAGVNLSGDLKDPQKSIPIGTMAAIGVGYVIYMTLPIFLGLRADALTLIEDPLIMRKMALWGDAILLGVWGATLSSAMGSILGAPRILQALARDGVLPRPLRVLGRGSGPADEPRIGTLITLAVALTAVALGDLNLIAPILTMFFLTTYGVVNVVSAVERLLGSPSFRPTFRVHWSLSLLGAAGCVFVMVLINWLATLVAIIVILGIYVWLERRELQTAWGDVRQGLWMAVTRAGLLQLRDEPDAKNWRPHMLVMSGAPTKRWHLIDLANAITHNRALLSVATIVTDTSLSAERQAALETTLSDYLEQRGVQALLRVTKAADPFAGQEMLIDAYGLGSLQPNTIVLGHSETAERLARFTGLLAHIYRAKRNLIVVKADPERGFGERKRIDLWWGGLKGNGGLMMTLAYLLKTSLAWRDAEVRVKIVIDDPTGVDDAEMNLRTLIGGFRTGAVAEVLVAKGRAFDTILRDSSAGADLVLLGMRAPEGDGYVDYYRDLSARTADLPTTAFVLAAEALEFSEILN